jgi:hypothetical protein
MQIYLTREIFNATYTLGKIYIPATKNNIEYKCYTLEDLDRDIYQKTPITEIARVKIMGETAIPYGTYEVGITYSNRFKRLMPQLFDVPGFSGIRIHTGNFDGDTDGCILVGIDSGDDMIFRSREAYAKLFPILQDACSKEKVFITIQKQITT